MILIIFIHLITNNCAQPDATINLIKKSLQHFPRKGCSDFIGFLFSEVRKVKIAGVEKEERQKLAEEMCNKLQAELVQHIGHIAVIYRKKVEK